MAGAAAVSGVGSRPPAAGDVRAEAGGPGRARCEGGSGGAFLARPLPGSRDEVSGD